MSASAALAAASTAATAATTAATTVARKAARELHGIVVSAGLMDKTVKVKLGGIRWEPRIQKYFKQPQYKLVHDPRNSVRQGDVVAITNSWRVSQHVRHVIKHIIAPYGEPIEAREPVPTLEERVAESAAKRAAKDVRRKAIKDERIRIRDEERALRKARKAAKMRQWPPPPTETPAAAEAGAGAGAPTTSPDDVD